jgi:acetyl esterase
MPLNMQAVALLQLLEERGGIPVQDSTPEAVRIANWDWLDFQGPAEPVAAVDDTYIPGPTAELHVRSYHPETVSGLSAALVYFHGGGWTAGNIQLADRPNRSLANATGCVVVAVNYQKAPEHRYPTALDDCYAAVQWVHRQAERLGVDSHRIGVGGDSAGGNLAAAVCLKARGEGGPPIAFQLLIYPAVDPDLDFESARDNAEGYSLTTAAMRWFWDNYAPERVRPADPLAAPLRAMSLDQLPPAIVVTAEYDPLRDEGRCYADRLEAAGVTTIRRHYPTTIHGFLWMAGALTEDFQRFTDDVAVDVLGLLAHTPERRS